jgi:ligand-binding sensor domain-containing protein
MRTPIPTKACLRVALFICCVVALATQSAAERLPIKIFTSADGLGSSFINSLMRDSRGFLWVCTRDGLSRFDGSRFVTYQIGDNGAPPGIEQILTNTNTNTNTNANANADADTNANADTNADTNANADTNTVSVPNSTSSGHVGSST